MDITPSFSTSTRFMLLLMAVCIFCGCRKETLITISGLITDPNHDIPVDAAKVEIWTQEIDDGIFLANYVLAGTITTGSDGKFQLNLEQKNYTGIRLNFSKEGYYGWGSEVNIEKVKTDQKHYGEYQLLPKASLKIWVKNTQPFDGSDYFEFRIMNGYTSCDECCKGEKYVFTGMDIDQTIDCQTVGQQDILIQWTRRKNGEEVYHSESHFIKPFETTLIELNY